MTHKVILVLALSFGLSAVAQIKYSNPSEDFISFHNHVSAAERMFKNDSLLQAYAKYDIAFSSYKGAVNPSHYFKACLCALKIKEEFKALGYLEKAITNGYEVDSVYKDAIVFYNQNTKKEYQANIGKWEAARDAAKNSTVESEIYSTLEPSRKFETPAYKTATEFCLACLKNPKCSKTAPDYVSKYRIVKEKMKADSINAESLIKNIKQFGFPGLKLVDKGATELARNILLNYDMDKKNERLDAILFKALNDGDISPAFYASVIDRRQIMSGLSPEFYEPLMGYEKTIGKDVLAANKKRSALGLYPVIIPNPALFKGIDPKKNVKAYNKLFVCLYDY